MMNAFWLMIEFKLNARRQLNNVMRSMRTGGGGGTRENLALAEAPDCMRRCLY
jgi:hypothetical protein